MSLAGTDDGDRDDDSVIAVAEQHRQLQNQLHDLEAVFDANTICDGPDVDTESPQFRTEITLVEAVDGVTPPVLEAVADADLSLVPQPPQGSFTVVYAE